MTDTDTLDNRPVMRISGPGDAVNAIPYLLGFAPAESLVLVALDNMNLVLTARLDLDDVMPETINTILVAMHRAGADSAVIAIYTDDAGPDKPYRETVTEVQTAASGMGVDVKDALLVGAGRYWSYDCPGTPPCCPPEGRPIEENSLIAATAVSAGLRVRPSREALGAVLDPDEGRARLQDPLAVTDARKWPSTMTNSVKREMFKMARACDAAPLRLSDDQLVRFGAALRDIAIRDALWMAIDDGTLKGRELWQQLATRLPGSYAAAPLFLFAWDAWRNGGDGALSSIAAQRALDADPDYSAAELLIGALSRGVNPGTMPKLRQSKKAT